MWLTLCSPTMSLPPPPPPPWAQAAANKQYLYQFVLHASLDATDDIVWTTNSMYLKVRALGEAETRDSPQPSLAVAAPPARAQPASASHASFMRANTRTQRAAHYLLLSSAVSLEPHGTAVGGRCAQGFTRNGRDRVNCIDVCTEYNRIMTKYTFPSTRTDVSKKRRRVALGISLSTIPRGKGPTHRKSTPNQWQTYSPAIPLSIRSYVC